MKLILKTLKQQIHEVDVDDENSTVQDLKVMVEAKYGIKTETIKLVFNGNVLKDDATIKSNNITDGNTIVMIISKAKVQNKPEEQQKTEVKPKPEEKVEQVKPSANPNVQQVPTGQSSAKKEQTSVSQPKDYTNEIKTLVEMGFPKEYAESAIKAAKGNVNIAIEFLYNGIPDVPANEEAIPEGEGEGLTESTSPVELVKRIGSVVKILCVNDPGQLQNIILELARTQPELVELIKQHEAIFKERINQPPNEEDYQIFQQFSSQHGLARGQAGASRGGSGQGGRQDVIRLSKEEFEAVKRLKEFGFTEMEAAQAYFACDKNEELALNFLFEMKNQESNCKYISKSYNS